MDERETPDERQVPSGYTGGGISDDGTITGAGGGTGTAGLVDVPAPHPQADVARPDAPDRNGESPA